MSSSSRRAAPSSPRPKRPGRPPLPLVAVDCREAEPRLAAPWERPGDGSLELTRSELGLLFEGSELALRRPSPPRYDGPAPLVFR